VESVKRVNIEMKKLKDELEKTECLNPGIQATLRSHVQRVLYPFNEETLKKYKVLFQRLVLTSTLDVLKMLAYLGLINLVLL
jgi:hypothetical protein